jgi:hypothetical protein
MPAVLLTDHFQGATVHAFDINDVGHEGRIQLDGQAGGQVHAERVVGNQHDGVGGQHIDQQFADHFRIGIGQGVKVELEHLA